MSIPKMMQDLAVISKLSDLPNSNDGLTAAELKARFDEAPLALQKYINDTMIPALTAARIPYAGSSAIQATNIQDAIASVHAQIRDASEGTIANGSVTKEKLSADLLSRTFGGVPWVSMVEPGAQDNPDREFPIGQLWLRPGFTVVNAAGQSWSGNGCTVTEGVVTGNKSSSNATMTQTLSGIGKQGDRVMILFDILDKNSEVQGITIRINGSAAQDASSGRFEAVLGSGGSLTVVFTTTWSSAALAYEGWRLADYTVAVPDQAVRQTEDAEEPEDWMAFIMGLQPFEAVSFPATVWIQTLSGIWWPILVQTGAEGSFLRAVDGKPEWVDKETTAAELGAVRRASGSYTGSGTDRVIPLPVEPLFLMIAPEVTNSSDNPEILCADSQIQRTISGSGTCTIRLSGSALELLGDSIVQKATLMNRSGVVYRWHAVY